MEILQCDICKKSYKEKLEKDEFLRINKYCGYDSIFSDGTKLELDICQYCLKTLIGPYL